MNLRKSNHLVSFALAVALIVPAQTEVVSAAMWGGGRLRAAVAKLRAMPRRRRLACVAGCALLVATAGVLLVRMAGPDPAVATWEAQERERKAWGRMMASSADLPELDRDLKTLANAALARYRAEGRAGAADFIAQVRRVEEYFRVEAAKAWAASSGREPGALLERLIELEGLDRPDYEAEAATRAELLKQHGHSAAAQARWSSVLTLAEARVRKAGGALDGDDELFVFVFLGAVAEHVTAEGTEELVTRTGTVLAGLQGKLGVR